MMQDVGVDGIEFVALSHGHEDHDGGLYDVTDATGAKIVAHKTYRALIGTYPDHAPSPSKREFPASCWDCSMPASFYAKHCLRYHQERRLLEVGDIEELPHLLDDGVSVIHVPGHSPDAVALRIDDEVVLVGDTILPDITPHPTREEMFEFTRDFLPPE
jgi:glyoxylase-like metal-dependent hydrolase (beta-lactamase superfamily II)